MLVICCLLLPISFQLVACRPLLSAYRVLPSSPCDSLFAMVSQWSPFPPNSAKIIKDANMKDLARISNYVSCQDQTPITTTRSTYH